MWDAEALINYWFSQPEIWWTEDRLLRSQLRRQFVSPCMLASSGNLDHWAEQPRTALALLLLSDPLPRLIYHETAVAFEEDARARRLARAAWRRMQQKHQPLLEEGLLADAWFLRPLANSEVRDDQLLSVAAHRDLAQRLQEAEQKLTPQQQALVQDFIDEAQMLHDIFQRFGRFPQRNTALGRATRVGETCFLAGRSGCLQA